MQAGIKVNMLTACMTACGHADETHLSLMALPKHALMSLESRLQEVLNGVAVLNKTGPNRDKWQVWCWVLQWLSGETSCSTCGGAMHICHSLRHLLNCSMACSMLAFNSWFVAQRRTFANLQVKPEYRGQHRGV